MDKTTKKVLRFYGLLNDAKFRIVISVFILMLSAFWANIFWKQYDSYENANLLFLIMPDMTFLLFNVFFGVFGMVLSALVALRKIKATTGLTIVFSLMAMSVVLDLLYNLSMLY